MDKVLAAAKETPCCAHMAGSGNRSRYRCQQSFSCQQTPTRFQKNSDASKVAETMATKL